MPAPEIRQHHSPNFDDRSLPISMIIIHYTGMMTAAEAKARLCDADAKVSAHYLISEDGDLVQMVSEDKRAWHAGVSYWQGERDINSSSVGIELANKGHDWGYHFFPDAQINVLMNLVEAIMQRHAILPERVIGHSDIAPTRKLDPGELFPWDRLAARGLAQDVPPDALTGSRAPMHKADQLVPLLQDIGYDTEDASAAIAAFQRHFRPRWVTGQLDAGTAQALYWLTS